MFGPSNPPKYDAMYGTMILNLRTYLGNTFGPK